MTSASDSVLAVCRRGAAEQDARTQAPSAVIRFTALARVHSLLITPIHVHSFSQLLTHARRV